jgi:hypothetical protein
VSLDVSGSFTPRGVKQWGKTAIPIRAEIFYPTLNEMGTLLMGRDAQHIFTCPSDRAHNLLAVCDNARPAAAALPPYLWRRICSNPVPLMLNSNWRCSTFPTQGSRPAICFCAWHRQ